MRRCECLVALKVLNMKGDAAKDDNEVPDLFQARYDFFCFARMSDSVTPALPRRGEAPCALA